MKTVAIIQARISSTRLPGKVLLDLAGGPMLARVVERTSRARLVDRVVVATTIDAADKPIVALCRTRKWPVHRGSRDDVLDRYYQTALAEGADRVVRITSDCPAIEAEIIDRVIECLDEGADYASNVFPVRTFPRGLDVEAFPQAAIAAAWREDHDPWGREHVTPFFHRHPERFRIATVESSVPESAAHRWAVDAPEDYDLLRRIYDHFGGSDFTWHDVLALLELHPDWAALNRHVAQKSPENIDRTP